MIGYMGAQQKKQLEGLEELALFTAREMGMFKANIYPSLLEQVHQTLAQTSLALNWLNEDVANFDGLSNQAQFTSLVSSLDHHKSQVSDDSLVGCIAVLLSAMFSCSNTYKS